MNFSWSERQLALRDSAIEFARRELNHDIVERESACQFSREDWKKCAEFGVQGLSMPKVYGGQGHDLLTNFLFMEGLGYGCRDNGLTFALNAQYVSVSATLLDAGSDEQKRRYLRGVCDGDLIGAYGMTEPESGSDAFSLQSAYQRTDDGFVLNGRKSLLTFGPVADFFLVFATGDPTAGRWGISLFILDRNTPGLEATATMPKMGLRTAPIGELTMTDCVVPAQNIVGDEGSGAAIFSVAQDLERAAILASQLGAMEYQLERAIDHATSRQQFGQSVGKFQAVSGRIAEMKMRLDIARLLAYKAVWMIQEGEPATMEAAIANINIAEGFVQSSMDAIMIHGGRSYLTESEVERDLRDAIGSRIYSGTSEIQRNLIASGLGL